MPKPNAFFPNLEATRSYPNLAQSTKDGGFHLSNSVSKATYAGIGNQNEQRSDGESSQVGQRKPNSAAAS